MLRCFETEHVEGLSPAGGRTGACGPKPSKWARRTTTLALNKHLWVPLVVPDQCSLLTRRSDLHAVRNQTRLSSRQA